MIFAGGTGTRMNTKTKPKQFLTLHNKEIIIYTLEHFENHPEIDGISVVCIEGWIDYLKKPVSYTHLLKKIGEDMKKKQKSIKINLIMNTIKTLMSLIFPLITFPYASRILGATGIGRVNYASSIVSYFSMFAALGISTYAVREGARIRDDKEKFSKFSREMLNINLCTTFIAYCALAVFLALPILGNYKKLLVISSLSIIFTTIGTEWIFTIKEEYAYITKRAILFQIISLILLFVLVKNKNDYYWYAALTVISSGGSAFFNLWHSRKIVDWKQKKERLEYRKHLKMCIRDRWYIRLV